MNWSNNWDDQKQTLISTTQYLNNGEIREIKHVQLIIHLEDDTVHWIDAQQIGDLAIHKPIADMRGMWRRITHVPTLTMFDNALPCDPVDDNQLLHWIAEVQKGCLEEWKVLRELTPENYRGMLKAKDKILNYCQSMRMGE